jgi:phasin family protein
MQQKNSASNFFADIQNGMKDFLTNFPSGNAFDLKAVLDTQRRNAQVIAEINEKVVTGWQALAKRQAEMAAQFMQDNSEIARGTMSEGTPQEKFVKQTDIFKSCYERNVQNTQELTEMLRKNCMDAAELLNKRVVATLSEIKFANRNKADE